MPVKFQLALLALITTATTVIFPVTVKAQQPSQPTASSCIREPESYIGPVTLVMLAYQGFFEKQGIPSAANLFTAYQSRRVTAKSLVEAAIAGCVLSSQMNLVENEGYLNTVDTQMRSLYQGN